MLLLAPFSISTLSKLVSILLAATIFAVLAGLATLAAGRPLIFSLTTAVLLGVAIGLFEEFYLQSRRGRWIRSMHPVRSVLVYTLVVIVIYVIAFHLSHLIHGTWYELPKALQRFPMAMLLMVICSVIGVSIIRIIHFIGIANLIHLIVGTYHRPVIARKILMFVDLNNSTPLAEKLGPLKTRSLVSKFISDISEPITDSGGEIYAYTGDGLIASWEWESAVRRKRLLRSIDAMFATLKREQPEYLREFGVAPTFRVGIHGGDVVMSEQGNTKKSIGIYGDTINIAARMQEAAQAHAVRCVISVPVARMLYEAADRLQSLGEEKVKGISLPIQIFEYQPRE